MRNCGRAGDMETGDRVLQQAVRLGDALVLAQMLEPRRHEKCLDKAAFLCGVLEYSPSVGAIATALARQFIHAVRSSPAPVCSFQRQVKGMTATAAVAATKCVVSSPIRLASLPQITLPSASAPKKIVMYKARPRPRTHSGSATCAETLRLASTETHAAPAIKLASKPVSMSRASANSRSTIAVPS